MMFNYFNYFYHWIENNPDKVDPYITAVYFALLNRANKSGWKDRFAIILIDLQETCGINSRTTMLKTLGRLEEFGFIETVSKTTNQYKNRVICLPLNEKHVDSTWKANEKHVESTWTHNKTIKTIQDNKDLKEDSIESIPTFNFENLDPSYIFKKQNEIDKLKIFNDPEVNIAFNDYLKHRISIKKYPSKNAIKLLVKRIREECGTNKAKAIEAMQTSVMNNWTSIVFDRNNKFTSSKPEQIQFNRSSTEHYK